jgi:hypothetical protein
MQPAVWIPVVLGLLLLLLAGSIWPEPAQHIVLGPVRRAVRTDPLALPEQTLLSAAAVYVPDAFDANSPFTPPHTFLSDFRNPCWRGLDGALRCLPLVHILGAYQCGASDLYHKMARHADFVPPVHSAPSFYFEQAHTWADYVRTFEKASVRIGEQPAARFTGEASAGMFTTTWTHSERLHQPYIQTMGKRWQACNANRSRTPDADALFNACMMVAIPTAKDEDARLVARAGAQLEVPHLLRAVQGEHVRLVAILRNPTQRLYAAFWHYPHYRKRFGATAEGFAGYHSEMAVHVRACMDGHGLLECALRFESLERRFERVFYHCDQVRTPERPARYPPRARAPRSQVGAASHVPRTLPR